MTWSITVFALIVGCVISLIALIHAAHVVLERVQGRYSNGIDYWVWTPCVLAWAILPWCVYVLSLLPWSYAKYLLPPIINSDEQIEQQVEK